MGGGVDKSELVVVHIDNEFVGMIKEFVLVLVLKTIRVDDRAVATEDKDGVVLNHDTAVAGESPSLVINEWRDEFGGVEVDVSTAVVLGKDSNRIAVLDVEPFDAVHQYLTRLWVVDMIAMLVAKMVVADLFAVEFVLDMLGGRGERCAKR